MGKILSQLSEQDRIKLDGIVKKMVDNNEPDENIQFVVNDFKQKYGKKKDGTVPPSPVSKNGGAPGSSAGQSSGLVQTGTETDLDRTIAEKWKKAVSPIAPKDTYDPADPVKSVKNIMNATGTGLEKLTGAKRASSESTGQAIEATPIQKPKKKEGIILGFRRTNEVIKNFEDQYKNDTYSSISHMMKATGIQDPETFYNIPDDQLDNIVRPGNDTDAAAVDRIKDARNVRKAMASGQTIEQMAAAYAGLSDKQTALQIERGSAELIPETLTAAMNGQPAPKVMGDPRNMFSEATLGKMMFDFLSNTATAQEVRRKPEMAQSFRDATEMLINDYPDFGKALLGNIISQKMEDMGINNSILNVVTKEETDKAVDELIKEGRLTEKEKLFYEQNMRGSGLLNLGKKLIGQQTFDTPGLLENTAGSFVEGAKNIYKGAAEVTGFREMYLGEDLLNARDMADRDNAVSLKAKGVWHEISQFGGQFLGQSVSIGGTGKLLASIKAAKNVNTAVAVAGGLQAYGNYITVARQLFPGEQLKQRGYATILSAIEMATERIFNDAKVVDGITGKVAPQVRSIISGFTPEKLASLEAQKSVKDIIASTLKDVPEFAMLAGKAGVQNVVEEDAAQAGQQIVDGIFKGKPLADYINAEELWQTTRQSFIGSPFIASMAARADMLKTRGVTARSILDMARNSDYWKQQITEYGKIDEDMAATVADKISNLDHAANVVATLDGFDLTEKQKAKYVLASINSKVRLEALKDIADPVIQKREKAAIAETQAVQEQILDGKDHGVLEGDIIDDVIPTGDPEEISQPIELNPELPEGYQLPTEQQPAQVEAKTRTADEIQSDIDNLENEIADLEIMKEDPEENQEELLADIEIGKQRLDELYREKESLPVEEIPAKNVTQQEAPGPAESETDPPGDTAVPSFKMEWKQPKGKHKVVIQDGKRVVKTKRGKVIPEFISKQVRKKGGLVVEQKVKNPEWNRIALQHAKAMVYNTGKTSAEAGTPPAFENEQEANRWVIENSENPAEIAAAYVMLAKEPTPLTKKDAAIARSIGKVKGDSFKREGDLNNITFNMAKTYFRKDGETIDQVALQASDYGEGAEISPSDVVDFMMRFPNGVDPDGMVKTAAHQQAETKFQELTGIPLDPGNGRQVIANMAAAQFSPVRQEVEDSFDPMDKEEVSDEKILNSPVWEAGGWKPVEMEGMDGFDYATDNQKNTQNDQTTQIGNATPTDGTNTGAESETGPSTGGEQRTGGRTDNGQPGGSENSTSGEGEKGYGIEEARKELNDINSEPDDDYDVPFMAASNTEALLKKSQSALAKAQRELSDAEDKISKTQASQQGMFGEAQQGSMFSVDRDEAKSILDPLRDNVKKARAEVERLTAHVRDENAQADGQMSLFSFGDNYSPAIKNQFDKIKSAIEQMFSSASGFKGVKVLTGDDFTVSAQATGQSAEYLKSGKGTVYGFVHRGTMYINGDKLNTNTPIHEASHIFTRWARINSPELYAAGQRLADGTRYLAKVKADPFYQTQADVMRKAGRPDSDIETMFRDEALAFAVGDKGAAISDQKTKQTFRDWLKNLWSSIKNMFSAKGNRLEQMSAEQFSNMTFDQFSEAMAKRILSGEQLQSETDISTYDAQAMANPNPQPNMNSKGVRIAQVVKKLIDAGTTDDDIKTLLNQQGYSDLLVKNIIANAKRLPKFSAGKPIDPASTVTPPKPAIDTFVPMTGKQKAKLWAKRKAERLFTINKGMPEFVLQMGEKATGTQNFETDKAMKTLNRLKAAAKEEGFSNWDEVDKVLRGLNGIDRSNDTEMKALFAGIPDQMQPIILNMRDQIDGLSIDMVGRGLVTPTQAMKIEKNLGEYMTRAYSAFTQKDWGKQVVKNKKVMDDALQYLYKLEYSKVRKNEPGITEEEAMAKANDIALKKRRSIIDGLDAQYNPSKIKTIKGRDNGILKTREDIPQEIRALLGEHTDPGTAFMMTIGKLAALRSQAKFLAGVRDMGMGTIFFEANDPNRPPEASVEFVSDGTTAWAPLGGLYTTPDVYEHFNETETRRNDAVNAWMKAIGVVRWGKTVGSIVTQAKNLESNIGFSVMNGHFDVTQIGKDPGKYMLDQLFGGSKMESAVLEAAAKQGLIGQNVGIKELQDMFNSSDVRKLLVAASTGDQGLLHKISKKAWAPVEYMNKIYSASDDFFKLYGFTNERDIISKARHGVPWSELTPDLQESVDAEAAERVKNTYPTYSRVWEGAKWLSKNAPVFGNFLSFQAESVRVLANTVNYIYKDIKDPQMKSAGLRRLAGFFTYNAVRYSALYTIAQMTGFGIAGFIGGGDDEDEQALEDINRFVMPFMVNGEKLVRKTGEGKYSVIDITSLEPYGIWYKTINALQRGVGPGLAEFLGPFGEREMTFKNMYQALTGYNETTGTRIWAEGDSFGNQVSDATAFLWKNLKPSTVGFIERMIEREDKANEILAMAGARSYTVDVVKSFSIKLANHEKAVVDDDYFLKAKQQGVKDPEKLKSMADKADRRLMDMLVEIRKDYDAAVRLGGNVEDLDKLMYSAMRRTIDPMQKVDYYFLKTGNPAYLPNRYNNKLRYKLMMQK